MIVVLKHNLCKAHNRINQIADQKRTDRSFEVGEWVYLKFEPHRQSTVDGRPFLKLAAKFYGPYHVIQKVGMVAYKL